MEKSGRLDRRPKFGPEHVESECEYAGLDPKLGLVDGVPLSTKEALKSLIMLVISEIWREQNNIIFQKDVQVRATNSKRYTG